jgi:hypothetical protein
MNAKQLTQRITKGNAWLWQESIGLNKMEDAGVGSDREARYLEAFDLRIHLERLLRFVYGFEGCINGPQRTCDPIMIVRCEYCGEGGRS